MSSYVNTLKKNLLLPEKKLDKYVNLMRECNFYVSSCLERQLPYMSFFEGGQSFTDVSSMQHHVHACCMKFSGLFL